MSVDFHTAISVGAAANAATFNTPLGTLDAAIGDVVADVAALTGGVDVIAAVLKEWTSGLDYELTSITRNGDGVVTSATVKWPDTSGGTFTATTINATYKGIDAYTISHSVSGKTVTQAAVTRNASGDITVKPALTV